MNEILFVAIGGSAGAIIRYLFSKLDPVDFTKLPIGTLLVNIFGSILFVFLIKQLDQYSFIKSHQALIFTGFLGALTTYSTFNYQMIKLMETNHWQFLLYASLTFFLPLISGVLIYKKL